MSGMRGLTCRRIYVFIKDFAVGKGKSIYGSNVLGPARREGEAVERNALGEIFFTRQTNKPRTRSEAKEQSFKACRLMSVISIWSAQGQAGTKKQRLAIGPKHTANYSGEKKLAIQLPLCTNDTNTRQIIGLTVEVHSDYINTHISYSYTYVHRQVESAGDEVLS